jgi:uncharacterized repeat protein (TIGR01451 family)
MKAPALAIILAVGMLALIFTISAQTLEDSSFNGGARETTRDLFRQMHLQTPSTVPLNIQVSHSGLVSGASHYVTDFSEVMVDIDPTDPNHLLGASKFFYDSPNYGFYTGVLESYDGGFTWTQLQPTGVEDYDYTSDPVTTFDHVGNGYFTLLTREWEGTIRHTSVDMLKKPEGGDWGLPVLVDNTTYTDKQWIMGDQNPQGSSPNAGNLYMSWVDLETTWRIMFTRSTDANGSWSSPPLTLDSERVQAPVPGVAPDGTVYVVYGRDNYFGLMPATLNYVKSTDAGVSFSSPAIVADIINIPYTLPQSTFRTPGSFPAFVVSPVNGNLYVAWADYGNGDADIYFTRSTNGGDTWETPVRLNDDPIGNGIDQWQPQLSVAPNGRIAAIWFDRRLACPDLPWIPADHVGLENFCIDTFMTRSYDDGQTWVPDFRVSSQTWDWSLNLPITRDGYGFIGDYQGVASNNDYDFPFWNATADLGENPGNNQQVFIARVPAPFINLSATKTVAPEEAAHGEMLTYAVSVNNLGPEYASAVRLTDTIPAHTAFVPGSLTHSPTTGVAEYDGTANAVKWHGPIPAESSVTVTFGVRIDYDIADQSVIINTAVVTGGAGIGYAKTATATVNGPPFITASAPSDGATQVAVSTPLVISFNEPVVASSLLYTVTPNPGGWQAAWSPDRRTVTLAHSAWDYEQTVNVTVTAQDQDGRPLASGPVPNPWSFTTQRSDVAPYVLEASPMDGTAGISITVPVVVTFSEPMLSSSLVYTVTPDPGGWDVVWSPDLTRVTLNHDAWGYAQTVEVEMAAQDQDGLALAAGPVANPWSFSTQSQDMSPFIVRTSPMNGAVGVPTTAPVEVTFSDQMLTSSLVYTVTPDTGGWSETWSADHRTVTLNHDDWSDLSVHEVALDARNTKGQPLVPGPVPNPWSFAAEGLLRIYLPLVVKASP